MIEADENGRSDFPEDAINQRLQSSGGLIFVDETLETLVDDTWYGDPVCFLILSLLVPQLKTDIVNFHVDHLHPQSRFTERKLRSAGVPEEDIQFCLDWYGSLPNLHLLEGLANIRKKDSLLVDWLSDPRNKHWKRRSLIPRVNLEMSNFRQFCEKRRALLLQALKSELGYLAPTSRQVIEEDEEDEDLATGEVEEA